jgi:hypothetical protein
MNPERLGYKFVSETTPWIHLLKYTIHVATVNTVKVYSVRKVIVIHQFNTNAIALAHA